MELGLYSFAETRVDPETGRQLDAGRRIRNLIEEIEVADQVGLDVFGVGEHHRPDYAVSAPAVVLTHEATGIAFGPFSETMSRIGRERGWPPWTRAHFEAERGLTGALVLGSPREVIDKILYQHELFGHQRFLLQLTVGPIPHEKVLRAIELFGTEVAPVVRREVGGTQPEPRELSS